MAQSSPLICKLKFGLLFSCVLYVAKFFRRPFLIQPLQRRTSRLLRKEADKGIGFFIAQEIGGFSVVHVLLQITAGKCVVDLGEKLLVLRTFFDQRPLKGAFAHGKLAGDVSEFGCAVGQKLLDKVLCTCAVYVGTWLSAMPSSVCVSISASA